MRNIFFLILLFCFSSCHKKQLQEKPVDLLPFHQMTELLADIYLLEGTAFLTPSDSNRKNISEKMYHCLFQEYDISREQFIASITYYLGDEDHANELMASALEKTELRREKFIREEKVNLEQEETE